MEQEVASLDSHKHANTLSDLLINTKQHIARFAHKHKATYWYTSELLPTQSTLPLVDFPAQLIIPFLPFLALFYIHIFIS